MYVTYTARRVLSSGHDAGNDYSLVTDAQDLDPQYNPDQKQTESIDGTLETDFKRLDVVYGITPDIILAEDLPLWMEFLNSVCAGETFTLDFDSMDPDTPVSPLAVRMEKPGPVKPKRLSNQWWSVSFMVRVQADLTLTPPVTPMSTVTRYTYTLVTSTDTITGADNNADTFTAVDPDDAIEVFANGVLLAETDYSITGTPLDTITAGAAFDAGTIVEVVVFAGGNL